MCNDGEELINIVKKIVLSNIKVPKIDGISATKIIKKRIHSLRLCLIKKKQFLKWLKQVYLVIY